MQFISKKKTFTCCNMWYMITTNFETQSNIYPVSFCFLIPLQNMYIWLVS